MIATIATLLIVFLMRRLYRFYYIRTPYDRIWGFKENEAVFIVNGKSKSISTDREDVFALNTGDVKALLEIVRSLEGGPKTLQINSLFSDQMPAPVMTKENVICIGGPNSNSVTKTFLELVDCRYEFDSERKLVDKQTRKKYSPVKAESGDYYVRDYGIVFKASHPSREEKRLFIHAGCHTEGTMGAGKYISSAGRGGQKRLRQLAKELGGDTFQILIEVDVVKDEVGMIEVGQVRRVP